MSTRPYAHVHVFKSKRTIRKRNTSKTVWIVALHQPNGMTIDRQSFPTKKLADTAAKVWRRGLTATPPPG